MQAVSKSTITPVAAAVTAALYPGHSALAQDTQRSSTALEEIVVTARKRTESAQDIPIAIQAITQESIEAMGARSMEDYSRFIPSINVVSYSNASSTIVFRGAITGAGYIAQSTSSVYLDEISITNTGSQPGIRAVDIERVEALSGPQGTLYGSDAQAGTLRIVTNKPDPTKFEAIFDGELRGGDQSDMSYRGSLVFNVPLVEDKLALRIAGFRDRDGGFVDNVYGHTADTAVLQDPGFYPAPWGTLDNAASVKKNWNDSDIYGGRLSLRWDINDKWAATVTGMHQTTDSGADNYYDPYVGDLKVVRFHDEWSKDKFNMYSLQIDGDLGFAQLVSATSYYDRDVKYLADITTYAHYWSAQYCHDSYYMVGDPTFYSDGTYAGPAYGWTNPDSGYIVWWPVYCHGTSVDADFYSAYFGYSQQDKFTQEIRLSHSGEKLDWIVGLYYEDSTDAWQAPFAQPTLGGDGTTNMYQQSTSLNFWEWYWSNYYGTPVTYPNATSHWASGSHTDWEQKAVFGEATWHINDQFDLTLGGRYFDRSNTNYYFVDHPGSWAEALGTPGLNGEPDTTSGDRDYRLAHNGLPPGRSETEKEFIPKVSLSWQFADNKMIYGLYTRGKRPGGVNRSRGEPFFPTNYDSDIMDNYEMGLKTLVAEGRGRLNATAYHMKWKDYQLELVDPASATCIDPISGLEDLNLVIPHVCGQPWQQVVANAGEAHINGLNVEADFAPNDSWVLGGNAEWTQAETDTEQDLNGDGTNDLVKGLRLPITPKFKASGWIEYHWPVQWFGPNNAFVRTQWSYMGDTLNILEPLPNTDPNPQQKNSAYTIGDLRAGLQGEDWEVSIFVNNLTDERAQYTHNTGWFEWAAGNLAEGRAHTQTIYTNRPREFGVRFMKRWGD